MSAFQAIVLGIVQGLTEFLPISSTAHLRIVPAFAGWEDPGAAFTAVVQLGTMAAVLLYFRNDLWSISRGFLAGLRDPRRRGTLDFRMGMLIIIGLAQSAALVPGVSRSGATISAGLFLGLDRAAAARYSFLLSVPAVVLSGLFELRKIGEGEGTAAAVPTAIATLCAFVVGYASIAFLLRYLASHSTVVFVVYRVALGTLVLVCTAAGVIG